LAADDPARALVRHAEEQPPAALVRERHAIPEQLGGVVLILRLLELDVLGLGGQ
jgi:hypothetical protein